MCILCHFSKHLISCYYFWRNNVLRDKDFSCNGASMKLHDINFNWPFNQRLKKVTILLFPSYRERKTFLSPMTSTGKGQGAHCYAWIMKSLWAVWVSKDTNASVDSRSVILIQSSKRVIKINSKKWVHLLSSIFVSIHSETKICGGKNSGFSELQLYFPYDVKLLNKVQ